MVLNKSITLTSIFWAVEKEENTNIMIELIEFFLLYIMICFFVFFYPCPCEAYPRNGLHPSNESCAYNIIKKLAHSSDLIVEPWFLKEKSPVMLIPGISDSAA